MLNENLINETVKIVNDYYEAEGIYETNEVIRNRAINWYNHTEVVDPYSLASLVMWNDYRSWITAEDIEKMKEYYFPEEAADDRLADLRYVSDQDIAIWELEAAERDALWA